MNKKILVYSIIFLIAGILIGGFLYSQIKITNNPTNFAQTTIKNPFGFECWNTSNIQEVRFNLALEEGNSPDVTDCGIYLRNNYENPNFWAKSENHYQCILYGFNINTKLLDCSCEYIRKNLN
jgi:hypothetical protein